MQYATLGNTGLVVSRLVDRDSRAPVLGQDPALLGMGFPDVDREERDPISIAVGQSVERPHLGAEGRSGVRPEDERDRPLGEE